MSNSYDDVMARRSDIMRRALALDYDSFQHGDLIFDYDALMSSTGYSLDDVARIQAETKVGDTPLYELHRLTEAVREIAGPGKGARILLKDEAANASGSFKARRASLSAHEAQAKGFAGMVTATSGNYGAGVASQAAQRGLACIVIQEIYDSQHVGQPEIVEKSRACEAYGAEVIKLTVGPELFYVLLRTLEDTGYFNASLYTPYGIAGIETLGAEIGREVQQRYGRQPDAVVVTHAGGGNITGTTRGLRKMGCDQIVVVQETEYTGAGKHHNSQLSFARSRGIEVRRGDPAGNVPGKTIVIPERLDQVSVHPLDLDKLRHSYLRHASQIVAPEQWGDAELEFLAAETNTTTDDVRLIGTELATRTKGA